MWSLPDRTTHAYIHEVQKMASSIVPRGHRAHVCSLGWDNPQQKPEVLCMYDHKYLKMLPSTVPRGHRLYVHSLGLDNSNISQMACVEKF